MTFTDPNQIVKMFGPSISDPSKMVNRDVPTRDVAAYSRAGYQKGSIVEEVPEVVVKIINEAPKPKGKKK